MDRGVRTGFDHSDKRAPLFVIKDARTSGRLAIDESVRPLGVETKHPIAKGLLPDPSQPSRVRPRAAIVNRHESEKAPCDASRFLRKGQNAEHRAVKISA
jgi:hypothetical protein